MKRIRHPIRTFALLVLLLGFGAAFSSSRKSEEPAPEQAKSSVQPADRVWVSRPDGSQQCGMGEGKPVEEGAEQLKKAGIRVYESVKSSDGKMRIQLCGSPTGVQNAYQIEESDLPRALDLGFQRSEIHK